jgi:hypothetical protein
VVCAGWLESVGVGVMVVEVYVFTIGVPSSTVREVDRLKEININQVLRDYSPCTTRGACALVDGAENPIELRKGRVRLSSYYPRST